MKIEYTRGVGEGGDALPLNRNSVRIDFTIKCLAYCNGVVMPTCRGKSAFGRVELELQAIKEMEAGPIEERRGLRLIFGSEENGCAEEPPEAFHEGVVVWAVVGKMEKIEHLGGRIEMKLAGFLPQGERGHPDGDVAVMAEGQPEVGMVGRGLVWPKRSVRRALYKNCTNILRRV